MWPSKAGRGSKPRLHFRFESCKIGHLRAVPSTQLKTGTNSKVHLSRSPGLHQVSSLNAGLMPCRQGRQISSSGSELPGSFHRSPNPLETSKEPARLHPKPLLRAVMMLNRQMLVPSLFADTPTKEVDWGRTSSSPIQVLS